MSDFHFDYETTSMCDIFAHGAYRYAHDPSTRILIAAIAKDEGDPVVWRFDDPYGEESTIAIGLLNEAIESRSRIYSHNAQFEVANTDQRMVEDLGTLGIPDLSQWRCTQAMCRRAAIPEKLAKAAEFLKLDMQKEAVGKALINIFSDQNKIVTLVPPAGMIDPATQTVKKNGGLTKGKKPKSIKTSSPILDDVVFWDWCVKVAGQMMTVREAWELFIEYCRQDVRVERELHKKLARFELEGDELASFQWDMRMNYLGVPVNVTALNNAQRVILEYQDRLEARMVRMCGLRSGQPALLKWLQARGYKADNLQAQTVEEVLASGTMEGIALEVLKCRALLSFAAIKKIPTMLGSACPDGRVRGTTVWHGARTGRATGRIIQPHNMKKSTIPDSGVAYDLICEGADLPTFEGLWGSPLEVMSSCARHFMQRPEGDMLDADYVGVEARIAPWLAGETGKLDSILRGEDQYKVMAAEIIYNIPYAQVTKEQRTVGKPVELSCVYGTGGEGLRNALRDNHGVFKSLKECNDIVKAYRKKFSKLVTLWAEMEAAAKAAVSHGTVTHLADGKLAFGRIKTAGIVYLIMRLPSGRRMYYPNPTIKPVFKKYSEEEMLEEEWKREKGGYWQESLSFYGKYEKNWGRIHTWGSRLFENACQAIGADLLNYGALQAEAEGYRIMMIVHDQFLAEAEEGKTLEGYLQAVCRKQPWAESFPLEADGSVVPYYLKD